VEEYPPIRGFENYGVRIDGVVINLDTGRRLTHHVGTNGHVYVSLSKHNQLFPKLVGPLVGHVYLPPQQQFFDTIIHHDYDYLNNHAGNLSWRPRHFAVKYHRQRHLRPDSPPYPIICSDTNEVFFSPSAAAMSYGILEEEIMERLDTGQSVFPVGKCFYSY